MPRKGQRTKKSTDEIFREGTLIDGALKQAVQEALIRHKQAGNPFVVWLHGEIVWINPEEIPLQSAIAN